MDFFDFQRLIRPIKNKLFLLLGRAILKAVNNAEQTQKIQVIALSGEVITDMERFQEYGLETYPLAEAEVAAVFLNGNRDHGIALCVHDRRYRPTGLSAGEIMLYTDENSTGFRIHFKRNRILDTKGDQAIENFDTSKTVTAPIENHVNAASFIVASPRIQLGSGTWSALNRLIDERFLDLFNNHKHSGVTTGTGNTGVPTTTGSTASHATNQARAL